MDEGVGLRRTQVYIERLCGQTIPHASGRSPDECTAVGTGHIVSMLLEEQSRLLCKEKAGTDPERGLRAYGYIW